MFCACVLGATKSEMSGLVNVLLVSCSWSSITASLMGGGMLRAHASEHYVLSTDPIVVGVALGTLQLSSTIWSSQDCEGESRRPPDYSSNLCLPKTLLNDFFSGCLGLFI